MIMGFAAAGCETAPGPSRSDAAFSKVMRVNDVDVRPVSGTGQGVKITAQGSASTAGWVAPRLVPANPPSQSGVYRFDLVASRPAGMAAQVITPVTADYTLTPVPTDLKAVMVIAEQNSKTRNVP